MNEIIIFTTPTCPHCKTAKNFLNGKGINYREMDVSSDPAARNEMAKRKLMGVPSFIINGQTMVGFDPSKLEELLKKKIVKCPQCETSLRVPADKGQIVVTCNVCGNRFKS